MVSPILSRSREHLAENQFSYFGHMRFALGIGAQLLVAAVACILHAFLPAIFTNTASTAIRRLHATLASHHVSSGTPANHPIVPTTEAEAPA